MHHKRVGRNFKPFSLYKFRNPEEGYIKETLPSKIDLYKKYLRERGLLTDMKLIFLTLWKISK
jgi:lipopolysaccharide/colanic/teichoic acid biosynthesis glycosyltransferase